MPIPIPNRASGFMLGDPNARVKIDVFFDIQCPHSKLAWPTMVRLLTHYERKPVNINAHIITLSNHRQAWDLTLALFAVAQGNAKQFYDFVCFLFENQDQFYNDRFTHKTHQDLIDLAINFAKQHADVNVEEFLRSMNSHETYIDARTPIRYAATKSVWATPTFFINNADDVPLNFDSSLEDWIAVIDPLILD